MASEEFKLRYARAVLSRLYPADDAGKLAELKALAATTFAAATDTITITSGSFEGGQGTGVITFEKVILGMAIEERLAAIDPDHVAPAAEAPGFVMQFSPL